MRWEGREDEVGYAVFDEVGVRFLVSGRAVSPCLVLEAEASLSQVNYCKGLPVKITSFPCWRVLKTMFSNAAVEELTVGCGV